MTDELRTFVAEKSKEMMAAASCSQEAKDAAQMWLDAAGTEKEAEATRMYIAELEEDVTPIDGLIAFAGSDAGKAVFGDGADAMLAHAKEVKAAGGKYCDCPACAAGAAILEKKDELL